MEISQIFLRRNIDAFYLRPYIIETDSPKHNNSGDFGGITILLPNNNCPYIVGISMNRNEEIHLPIGMIDKSERDLTNIVYNMCIKYGQKLAKEISCKPEFVDKTGGPVDVKIGIL